MRDGIKTFKLSAPIIAGEYLQILTSIFGVAMVGRFAYSNLGIVAIVNSVTSVGFVIGVGMTLALLQQISYRYGRNEYEKIPSLLFNAMTAISLTSILISIILVGIGSMVIFGSQLSNFEEAISFLALSAIAMIFQLQYISFRHFLEAFGLTHITFTFSIFATILHVSLSWIFIYGKLGLPPQGLKGYAISSILSYAIMVVAIARYSAFYWKRKYDMVLFRLYKLERNKIIRIFNDGIPISSQLGIEILSFSFIPLIIMHYGLAHQAAYQVCHSFLMFLTMGTLGLAQGTSIRLNQLFGKGNMKILAEITKQSVILVSILNLSALLATSMFSRDIASFFTKDKNVISLASDSLVFTSIFLFLNAIQIVLFTAARAIRDFKLPTIYMIVGFWMIAIPLAYLTSSYGLNIRFIWISFSIGTVISTLAIGFRLNKKMNNFIIPSDKISTIENYG